MEHKEFKRLMQENWSQNLTLPISLLKVTDTLQCRNRNVFGNIFAKKKEAPSSARRNPTFSSLHILMGLIKLEDKLLRELNEALLQRSYYGYINQGLIGYGRVIETQNSSQLDSNSKKKK